MTATMSAAEHRTRVHRVIPKPLDGEAVQFGALVLSMVPPSVNNMFANTRKGRIKSAEYKTFQIKACLQLRRQPAWHVPGRIKVRLIFNRNETKADLDNLIKGSLDILMAAGRIADDRNVVEVCAVFEQEATGTRLEIRSARAE